MRDITDEEIAARVKAGDIESFGLLVERYEAKLARYGRKFFADNEDIKDLVQEVFIKTYANIQSFDASRRFSPWVYRIAHNEFVNAMKRKGLMAIFPFDLDLLLPHPVSKETADANAHRQDLKRLLDKCLRELNPKYREPLILYYFEEMGYREIAEVLQVPVSTVGVRLQRGRAMLEKLIAQFDIKNGERK